jgi:hypothetical protein
MITSVPAQAMIPTAADWSRMLSRFVDVRKTSLDTASTTNSASVLSTMP